MPSSKYLAGLSYVAFEAPDPEVSAAFYVKHLGLEITDRIGDAIYLRSWGDYYRYSLKLVSGPEAKLATMAWRTQNAPALQEAVARIEASGVTGTWHDEHTVGRVYTFVGPQGHPMTLHWDAEHYKATGEEASTFPDRPQRRSSHIGAPRQLDHISVAAQDIDAFTDWYAEVLDFKLMARTTVPEANNLSVFSVLTTNEKSHDLGCLKDSSTVLGRVNHYAYWVDTREELFQLADYLLERNIAIEYGPSIHGIGEQNFLYFRDPSGLRIEINTGGYRNYVPDWTPGAWTPAKGSANFYRNGSLPFSMTESFPTVPDSYTVTEEGIPTQMADIMTSSFALTKE